MSKPKRRRLPPGITYHEPSDSYFGRKTVVVRDGTKQRVSSAYAATPAEATDLLAKAIHQAKALDPERRTVEAFLGEWFARIAPDGPNPKKPKVREATYDQRMQVLGPLLPASLAKGMRASHPAFESLRVKLFKNFDEVDLRAYCERFAETGAGSRSVQLAWEVLRTAWNYAAQRRYVDLGENPFLRFPRPEHISERKEPLSDAEVARLLDAIRATKNPRSRTLLMVLVTTGLRISEALALRWEKLDLDKGEVKVRAQLTKAKLGPLKTLESRREAWTVDEVTQGLTALSEKAHSEWVFETARTHRPLDRNNVRSEVFRPMLKRAGLEHSGLTIHNLRSLAASLVAPGVDAMTLCLMFGWTNVNTARKFYVRSSDVTRGAGRDAMQGALTRIGRLADPQIGV
jgi:site-specific recombinase XerD